MVVHCCVFIHCLATVVNKRFHCWLLTVDLGLLLSNGRKQACMSQYNITYRIQGLSKRWLWRYLLACVNVFGFIGYICAFIYLFLYHAAWVTNCGIYNYVYYLGGIVVGWGTMLQGGSSRVRFPTRSLNFSIHLILPAALCPWSTRNLPGGKGWPERRADNLTSICESIVYKKWEPRRLTTISAFTACYRDNFTFFIWIIYRRLGKTYCLLQDGRVSRARKLSNPFAGFFLLLRFYPEDGGNSLLSNIGERPLHYSVSHLLR
jgi:hypothetical protein